VRRCGVVGLDVATTAPRGGGRLLAIPRASSCAISCNGFLPRGIAGGGLCLGVVVWWRVVPVCNVCA
jgi:hypothetical protein